MSTLLKDDVLSAQVI